MKSSQILSIRIQDLPDEDSIRLFISHIPSDFDEEKLRQCFETFGRIYLIDLVQNYSGVSSSSSKTSACCFITYYTRRASIDAQLAWSNLKILPGMTQPLQMQIAEKEPALERKVFIKQLSKKVEAMDLCKLLKSYGPIEECGLFMDSQGDKTGVGYAIFAAKSHLLKAFKSLHSKVVLEDCEFPLVMTLASGTDCEDLETSPSSGRERQESVNRTPVVPPGFEAITPTRDHSSSSKTSRSLLFNMNISSPLTSQSNSNPSAPSTHHTNTGAIESSGSTSCNNSAQRTGTFGQTGRSRMPKYSDVVKEDKSYLYFKRSPTPEQCTTSTKDSFDPIDMDFYDQQLNYRSFDSQTSPKYGAAEGWSVPEVDAGGGGDASSAQLQNTSVAECKEVKDNDKPGRDDESNAIQSQESDLLSSSKLKIQSKCNGTEPMSPYASPRPNKSPGASASERISKVSKGVQCGETKDANVQGTTSVSFSTKQSRQQNSSSSYRDVPPAYPLLLQTIAQATTKNLELSTVPFSYSQDLSQEQLINSVYQSSDSSYQRHTQFGPPDSASLNSNWSPFGQQSSISNPGFMTQHHQSSLNSVCTMVSSHPGNQYSNPSHYSRFPSQTIEANNYKYNNCSTISPQQGNPTDEYCFHAWTNSNCATMGRQSNAHAASSTGSRGQQHYSQNSFANAVTSNAFSYNGQQVHMNQCGELFTCPDNLVNPGPRYAYNDPPFVPPGTDAGFSYAGQNSFDQSSAQWYTQQHLGHESIVHQQSYDAIMSLTGTAASSSRSSLNMPSRGSFHSQNPFHLHLQNSSGMSAPLSYLDPDRMGASYMNGLYSARNIKNQKHRRRAH